ncbi:MAG TPA: hypothetical protein VK982_04045 [Bacteroidales bacterium]|nr:hypothetical protein [Bacteroidales bacterium]
MDNKEYNTLETRDTFNTKLGFILACVGSAVGMGNIWLFPYRVGQFGGAAFLIPYFIFVIPRFYVSTSKSIIKALINMRSFEIQLSPIG